MRREVENCFEEGKLRKETIDQSKVDGSLELSRKFLDKAKKVLPTGLFDIAFLTAYNSMFHSTRALLFKSGVKEQSHFCMVAYLRDAYESETELVEYLNAMDSYRIVRNNIQYRGEECTETDAKEAISDAEGLLEEVRHTLNLLEQIDKGEEDIKAGRFVEIKSEKDLDKLFD